jgi:ATP-dependent exoDNAse (exonuclease V) alpha subunit
VVASRRSDVRLLNDQIRTGLRQQGVLGDRTLVCQTSDGGREFRVGDQVLVTRNDHPRRLLNGTAGTVTQISRDGLRLRTRDDRQVEVDRDWLAAGQLDHGYAMTLHKAQGRTVHTALLLADHTLGSEAGYVGLSRGTHTNHLYLLAGDDPRNDDTCLPAPRQPVPTERDRGPYDQVMRHSRQQHLATGRVAEGRAR